MVFFNSLMSAMAGLVASKPRIARRRQPSCVLAVESLEARDAPATLTVDPTPSYINAYNFAITDSAKPGLTVAQAHTSVIHWSLASPPG